MWKAPLPRSGDQRKRSVGLLGGSFNPAHEGHVHVSRMAKQALGLDEVWWLVSPQNPLKPVSGMAPFRTRMDQAKTLTATIPFIQISDVESRLGTRYTADTVAILQKRLPGLRFIWLIGADNLAQLPRWRGWTRLMGLLPVAVMARPAYSLPALAGKAAKRFERFRTPPRRLVKTSPPAWSFLWLKEHPASASRIRACQSQG
ncbi:putative nicotinate-nucleotide adenylyltransferase [Rhodospirillaceae bacterium LM-1]|nr:putative nicotinate-nucleotide adenylyltransferase [Rhodospirillaceae bacterium LM-1]